MTETFGHAPKTEVEMNSYTFTLNIPGGPKEFKFTGTDAQFKTLINDLAKGNTREFSRAQGRGELSTLTTPKGQNYESWEKNFNVSMVGKKPTLTGEITRFEKTEEGHEEKPFAKVNANGSVRYLGPKIVKMNFYAWDAKVQPVTVPRQKPVEQVKVGEEEKAVTTTWTFFTINDMVGRRTYAVDGEYNKKEIVDLIQAKNKDKLMELAAAGELKIVSPTGSLDDLQGKAGADSIGRMIRLTGIERMAGRTTNIAADVPVEQKEVVKTKGLLIIKG
ncbi:MAG: hypothetical protein V1492_01435 [Candidatus Micrarchaeota archaeon]